MPLSHQAILITGAGGGLGSTAALSLAQQGAHIILLDNNLAKLEACYDAIVAAKAKTPILYPFDLAGANEDDYIELANRIDEKYGALHGLLHSAVEFQAFAPIASTRIHDWGHSLTVNLHAPFMLTRVLLPVLQKSGQASVVFTSDSSSRNAPAYASAYGVAKIALEGLAKILAEEMEAGNKIRVNTLIPGAIDSPLRKRAYPAEDKSKLPKMEVMVPVYRYLFGKESIGINGQAIDARTFYL
ncbi:MAG: SDR family NAD(P)-dependent oxidoreductase [Methylococcaceae bacterium]|jgi:NAD(P)-dependent dehydrogenase (short-subunit alcohol dehydrogenase family)